MDEINTLATEFTVLLKRVKSLHSLEGISHAGKHDNHLLLVMKNMERDHPEGVKPSDLSCYMKTAPPAVTLSLGRLEENGLIVRKMDATDRRIVRATLTPKGETALVEMQERLLKHAREIVEHIGPDRARTLVDTMHEVLSFIMDKKKKGRKES